MVDLPVNRACMAKTVRRVLGGLPLSVRLDELVARYVAPTGRDLKASQLEWSAYA